MLFYRFVAEIVVCTCIMKSSGISNGIYDLRFYFAAEDVNRSLCASDSLGNTNGLESRLDCLS